MKWLMHTRNGISSLTLWALVQCQQEGKVYQLHIVVNWISSLLEWKCQLLDRLLIRYHMELMVERSKILRKSWWNRWTQVLIELNSTPILLKIASVSKLMSKDRIMSKVKNLRKLKPLKARFVNQVIKEETMLVSPLHTISKKSCYKILVH